MSTNTSQEPDNIQTNPPNTPQLSPHALPVGSTTWTTRECDFSRDVLASKPPKRTRQRRRELKQFPKHAQVRAFALPLFYWIAAAITLFTILAAAAARLFTQTRFFPIAIIVAAPIVVLVILRIWRGRLPRGAKVQLAPEDDPRFRLRVTCKDRDAWAMSGLSDEAFEPRIFALPFTAPLRVGLAWALWIPTFILLGAGWWYVKRATGLVVMGRTFGVWDVWACMALASLPLAWLWPAYLRISPGRADILRYGPLGAGLPTLSTLDLRTARVAIDIQAGFITIEPPGADPFHIQVWSALPNRAAIAKALFEAARWQGDHLPLPDDALVG